MFDCDCDFWVLMAESGYYQALITLWPGFLFHGIAHAALLPEVAQVVERWQQSPR